MQKYTGACHCGKNKIEINAESDFEFVCYCHDCRVLNGGAHLCGVMLDDSKFTPADHSSTYQYKGGSGEPIILHFCPECSTQLYAYPTKLPGKVVVRANTLKDYPFKVEQLLFPESAFAWDELAAVK